MEVYQNIKKGTKIGLIIAMIFLIVGVGTSIYNLIAAQQPPADIVEAQHPADEAVDLQRPAEMNGEDIMAPANSPEVPHAGVPGYVKDIIYLVLYAMTAFYALFGYKKPHGNMLKYLYIAFAVGLTLSVCLGNVPENAIVMIVSVCSCLAALILVYVSGRFHKIEKNRVLLVVAGLLLFAAMLLPLIAGSFFLNGLFNSCSAPIMLLTLGFSYTARYEQHKTAGLEDKQQSV